MDKIHLAGPWITQLEMDYVNKAMSDWYDKPYYYCELFQEKFAAYHDRKYALMTPNCTSAIHLILLALGIKEGDEVIVPECTWIASAAPISYTGATTVFCDIEESNWCIDPVKLEALITPKTKAVIMVDLFGNMPNIDAIEKVCKKHNIYLIEDSAESLGSKYKGKKAGSFGIASVFSFHRTKTICTGEGGMLVLDDEELFRKCTILRDHGRGPNTKMYFNEAITPKYMPTNVLAALGYAQFLRLDELVNKKRELMFQYMENLKDVEDLQFNEESELVYNGVWITGLVFGKSHNISKSYIIDEMNKQNLPVRPFFYPLTSVPAYKEKTHGIDYRKLSPVAYDISARGINLPCAFNVTKEQVRKVTDGLKTILKKQR